MTNIYTYGTQLWTVVDMLREAGANGLTGRDFLRAYLPEYRSRINELRRDGYVIKRERVPGDRFVKYIIKDYLPLFAAVNQ